MKLSHVSHACMGDKSNCSVTCTLFKIAFLGKWDERGERPFLWPLTSFSDRHTHSVHSVQYRLSSCFAQFCWDWDLSRTGQKKPPCQNRLIRSSLSIEHRLVTDRRTQGHSDSRLKNVERAYLCACLRITRLPVGHTVILVDLCLRVEITPNLQATGTMGHR